MLVYDITNEKSFDNIKNWIRNIEEVCFRTAIPTDPQKKIFFCHCTFYCFWKNWKLLSQNHASVSISSMSAEVSRRISLWSVMTCSLFAHAARISRRGEDDSGQQVWRQRQAAGVQRPGGEGKLLKSALSFHLAQTPETSPHRAKKDQRGLFSCPCEGPSRAALCCSIHDTYYFLLQNTWIILKVYLYTEYTFSCGTCYNTFLLGAHLKQ